jgi:WD40 repeat protein
MAISPDGNQIVTNWSDPAIRLWNRHTGESEGILEGHTIRPIGIAYLLCGQWIASVSQGATVRMWDLHKAENRYVMSDRSDLGSRHAYKCLAVSSTGLQLAAGCYDNFIELFNVKTRRLVRSIVVDG